MSYKMNYNEWYKLVKGDKRDAFNRMTVANQWVSLLFLRDSCLRNIFSIHSKCCFT